MSELGEKRAKVIDLVRKLLAKANGTENEHEAAAFATKAHALLAENQIDMSEIAETEVREVMEGRGIKLKDGSWARSMFNGLAKMYFCEYFFLRIRVPKGAYMDRYEIPVFVGEEHNVMVAQIMAAYLAEAVERLAREAALKPEVNPKERVRFRISFRIACSQRLYWRFMEKIDEAKRGDLKTETGRNLPVLYDAYKAAQEMNQSYIAAKHGKMLTSKSSQVRHHQGAMAGDRAGRSIPIDQQVTAKDKAATKALPSGKPKEGDIKHSKDIDFTGDAFNRSHEKNPGVYVYFGMWKGPFDTEAQAKDAYGEWKFEARHG